MTNRLQTIRPRLAALARLDPDFEIFGADEHKYEFAPPLSSEAVASFELLHGVRLPEDYRAFLLEVGASGAGPYYGLRPLGDFEQTNDGGAGEFLATPFPHQTLFDPIDPAIFEGLSEEEEE